MASTLAVSLPITAREQWAQWLSAAPWDLFVTLTDPGYPHPEAMLKRSRYLEAKVNDWLYGKGWKRKGLGIETVTGLERQERGSVHTHAVWRLPDHDIRKEAEFSLRYWQRTASELGGFAWLQIPRDSEDVTRYVTKYVLKDGELALSPTLNPWLAVHYADTLLGRADGARSAPRPARTPKPAPGRTELQVLNRSAAAVNS